MAFPNYENNRGSGKKMKVHFDLPGGDDSIDHQKHSRRSFSSESSDDSDDTEKDESKHTGYGSPVWSFQGGPSTPTLPFPGYDPNRIPSSVFSAKPASPMEWSVASNESLFSIHIGNSSFSRDHAFAMNNRSGELLSWNNNDFASTPTTLATVQEVSKENNEERHSFSSWDTSDDDTADLAALEDDHKKTSNIETVAELVEEHDTRKEETLAKVETTTLDKTPDEDHIKEAKVFKEEQKSYPCVSYRSVESNGSFQFPILTNDGVRTSSSTVESDKQERNEKQQQQQQQPPLPSPVPPPKPKTETAPKHYCCRSWCCCSCCQCSSCY